MTAAEGGDATTFAGDTGVAAVVFRDGALTITLGESATAASRQAMHLSPGQAEQLRGFLRVYAAAARPPDLLDEARSIVQGDRERTHGRPDRNLLAIAAIWTALLREQLRDGHQVTPQLVCLMMAGLKLARASNRPSHREHALDVVGYMALAERCGYIDPPAEARRRTR